MARTDSRIAALLVRVNGLEERVKELEHRLARVDDRFLSDQARSSLRRDAIGHRSRILVVEPDPRVRAFICDVLGEGADVIHGAEIAEAVRLVPAPGANAGRRPFDAMIVECGEPDRRTGQSPGIDVIRAVCANDAGLPVIAMSAAADCELIAAEALRSGARDFLKKPFGVHELKAAVTRVSNPTERAAQANSSP
jgi:DNA-binding response OmpR family regulator